MTAEQTARRLDSAADELASMKAELAAAMEFTLDASGLGACEVLGKLNMAWLRHTELAGRLSAEVSGLAVAVRAAATAYREADESASVRLQGEGGAAGTSGSVGAAGASGGADVSWGASASSGAAGVDGEAAASWGSSGSAGAAGASGGVDVSAGGAARIDGETARLDSEAAASWGVAGPGGLYGDVGKEGR